MSSPVNFGTNTVTISAFIGTPANQVRLSRMFLLIRAERGNPNEPIVCKDDQDFVRFFGAGKGTAEFEANLKIVKDYFIEVGKLSDLVVVRLYEGDIDAGKAKEPTGGGTTPRGALRAANPGTWGNNLQRNLYSTSSGVYTIVVREVVAGRVKAQRTATGITLTAEGVERANFQLRGLAEMTLDVAGTVDFLSIASNSSTPTWVNFAGGLASASITDSTLEGEINAEQERSGLQVINQSGLGGGVIVAPSFSTNTQREILSTFAQSTARFYPQAPSTALLPDDAKTEKDTLSSLTGAEYSAYYYPLLREVREGVTVHRSPLGAVAGRIVRSVMERPGSITPPNGEINSASDVQRAPNGRDYVVHDQNLKDLNDYGLNCLYPSAGGITVTGLKLLAPDPINDATDKVHERILLNTLVYDIGPGLTQFAYSYLDRQGFLTSRITGYIRNKLMGYYDSGALYGLTPEEAFSVNINAVLDAEAVEQTGRLDVQVRVKASPVPEGLDVAVFQIPIGEKV